jgi:hypothetical protein
MGALRTALSDRPGVATVHANPATGSLLVHYDREALHRDDILGILEDVGLVFADLADVPAPSGGPHSTTAGGLIEAIGDLDARLSALTNRRVDLKLLFPFALGAIGLRQTLSQGLGLSQVPGYVLLWYAFDSFWKFHQQTPRRAAPDGPSGNGTAP